MSQALDAAIAGAINDLDAGSGLTRLHPEPYITALPADQLLVDRTYQRDLDVSRVNRMVAEFDRTLLGVLEVSDRGDGTFAIIEGQHRWAAVRKASGASFPLVCQVHRGLTVQDEAQAFREIDLRRKKLSWWDLWKARRASGDTVVHEIEEVVVDAGMTVSPSAGGYTIRATSTLEKIHQLGGRPLLTSTLSIVTAAYSGQQDAYDGAILQAVADILRYYRAGDELNTDRLVAGLTGIVPRQLKARAAQLRETTVGTMPRLVAAVIIGSYNREPGRKVEEFLERIKPRTSDDGRARTARRLAAS